MLDINKNALNLDPSKDTVTVDDVMGEGLYLAPDHTDYFKVYDVTNGKELTAGGTDGYTLEIGEKSNTFKLTVPDSTYIKVTYWAKFDGSDSYTNTANYYYEGVNVSNDGGQWKDSLKVRNAGASAWTSPFIKVYKYDQSGQALANVTFELYKVTVNSDGTVTLGDLVDTKTTGANGEIAFGYTTAGDSYHLDHETLYCIVETSAPAGYAKADPYYFELPDIYDHSGDEVTVNAEEQAAHVATHPTTITVNDKMPGETIGIVNTLSVPSYSIPLDKTINGSHTDSGVNFTFTLKPLSGTAYTDSTVKTQLETSGITVTNDGSGAVEFDKLYFAAAGTYTFSLTENDTTANGFTKDSTEYKVEIVVDIGSDNTLYIKSAKYYVGSTLKGDLLNGDVPTFDNTFSLNGSFTLTAKKEITNWPEGTDMPEFEFQVYRNNKVITTAKNTADGTITFNVPITHEDLGTDQRYVIKEVSGDDDRFVYDTSSVVASVDIVLDENGGLTGKNITYKTNNGTFTNEYNASGSLTLKGWKSLYLKSDRTNSITVKAKQFNFTVKEGNDVVSTGTTKSGGEITFSAINYVAAQKGYHYYTITEDRGTELFQNYDASPIYVIVNVHDAVEGGVSGNGKLTADVVYADKTYKTVDQLEKNENEDENQMLNILFINTCNFVVPTGINLSTLPFVLTLGGALCLGGVALALCIRKRRHIQQH
jgi:pilin isopeptide linkage protein